jgi:alpha-glucosidase
LVLCGALPASSAAAAERNSDAVAVQSPDGRLEIELFTRAASAAPGQLQYRVSSADRTVVDASNLGVRLKDGTELGRSSVIVGSKSVAIDSSFEQYPGKRRQVIDRASETTLTLRERGAKPLEWQLVVRAYDDGVALRYRFPKQPGWSQLELAAELTEFRFPADAVATMLPLASSCRASDGLQSSKQI